MIIKIVKKSFLMLLIFVPTAFADDYPTHEKVSYVLDCFEQLERSSFDDLQTCSCRIDSITSELQFEEYSNAMTYNRNRRMTGKKGGIFRDNKAGKEFSSQLATAEKNAGDQCKKVVHIVAPTDLTKDDRYYNVKEIKQSD